MVDRCLTALVAFAFGVLVRDVAQDWRDAAAKPAATYRDLPAPARELSYPLCPDGWIRSCSDAKECRIKCLSPLRIDDAAPARLEPKGHLDQAVKSRS